jgi:hypothetical protein
MLRVFALVLPFPFGTVVTAYRIGEENKVKVGSLRMTPAELLAFTRSTRRSDHVL